MIRNIHIVDCGFGNTGAIVNMIHKIGGNPILLNKPCPPENINRLIIPGIGAFDNAMQKLNLAEMVQFLNNVKNLNIPILGICIGMQLMCESSEEGELSGLGWFNATSRSFNFKSKSNLKVPHMGWNYVELKKENTLFNKLDIQNKFYFVHSFHVDCNHDRDVLGMTNYGLPFTSVIHKDNIYGVQFHPEKSHKYGLQLLSNFIFEI